MATAIIMPKQGQSVETCIITKWFKDKGDSVAIGDILFSYETDKAAFDLESTEEGILLDRYFDEGDEVPVLVNVAVVGKEGEATDSFKHDQSEEKVMGEKVEGLEDPTSPEIRRTGVEEGEKSVNMDKAATIPPGRIRISPRAKRMADDKNLNYSDLQGTGPNGRIIARDIEEFISSGAQTIEPGYPEDAEYTEEPLSNIRKIIANAMHSSLQNSAQLTHHMSADVSHLLEARKKIKSRLTYDNTQQDITLNDMICWCVIKALKKFPEANSHFLNDRIKTYHKVHLGLAVDTPRGLMVPALKNADTMDLVTISKELKSIADSCKKGSIDPELIQSTAATFTVSNLGNYGVEMFTPVVNLPQAGILGVCTIINRPVSYGDNIFGFVPHIGLSLTYDHRAIDGGPATLFLKEIKKQIEEFRY